MRIYDKLLFISRAHILGLIEKQGRAQTLTHSRFNLIINHH